MSIPIVKDSFSVGALLLTPKGWRTQPSSEHVPRGDDPHCQGPKSPLLRQLQVPDPERTCAGFPHGVRPGLREGAMGPPGCAAMTVVAAGMPATVAVPVTSFCGATSFSPAVRWLLPSRPLVALLAPRPLGRLAPLRTPVPSSVVA